MDCAHLLEKWKRERANSRITLEDGPNLRWNQVQRGRKEHLRSDGIYLKKRQGSDRVAKSQQLFLNLTAPECGDALSTKDHIVAGLSSKDLDSDQPVILFH
jgi:hypothetical protein